MYKNKMVLSDKIFTIVLILSPITSTYGIGLGTFTLNDLILFLTIANPALYKGKFNKVEISKPIFVYFLYVIFNIGFLFLNPSSIVVAALMRTLRYLFYLFIVVFYSKKHFLLDYGEKVYMFVTYFSVAYIILQTLGLLFGHVYISGFLPFLTIMRNDIDSYAESSAVGAEAGMISAMIRPRSIFPEPSAFAIFVLGYMAIFMFLRSKQPYFALKAAFLSVGIILSVSSTGMLCMTLMWIVYFVKNRSFKFLLIALVAVYIMDLYSMFDIFKLRIENGKSANDRFEGYSFMFEYVRNSGWLNALFGNGMSDITTQSCPLYLSAYPRMLLFFGWIGIAVYFGVMLSFLRKKILVVWALVILCVILNIGADSIFNVNLLLFFPFIIGYYETWSSNIKLQ